MPFFRKQEKQYYIAEPLSQIHTGLLGKIKTKYKSNKGKEKVTGISKRHKLEQ